MKHIFILLRRSFQLVILIPLLTGCWSSRDIEKLDLLIGVGVDTAQEENITSSYYGADSLLTVTYQMAKIKSNQGQNTKKQEDKPYTNVEQTGASLIETAREIIQLRKNTVNGQHQRLIIISREVAENRSIREILDFFIREPEARMSMLVMITDGLAKDILDYMETDDIPSMHIYDITENFDKSNKLLERKSLAKINALMEAQASFILQNVVQTDGELKLSGAAVIKGSTLKLIGFLTEEELKGINWITAQTNGAIVKVEEEGSDKPIIYEQELLKSKITPTIEDDKLSFQVKVKSEGLIIEVATNTESFSEEKTRRKLEEQIAEEIKKEIQTTLERIQKDLQVDVIGFHDYVRIKYPEFWKEHQSDWDTIFSQAPIDYEVQITITDFGLGIQN
ncbi:Ger(x)C family spore germination protein [Bacillus sp. m3-13]|uniref:Ger(x)C family spore germination protein n=1 Tax=Bacillus sp. m3-13 TaxID=406124 RepID=UPI0001E89904|nr:Ger(x)C family spore germination protein [Bacillus sp. m3-13]